MNIETPEQTIHSGIADVLSASLSYLDDFLATRLSLSEVLDE